MKSLVRIGGWRISLGLLQVFVGIGGVAGGASFIFDPSGAGLGAQASWLAGSPFKTYLVPGLFLFAVNGLGSLGGAWLLFSRDERGALASVGLGSFLMAWILCQMVWLEPVSYLQPFFFFIGAVEVVMGIRIMGTRSSK